MRKITLALVFVFVLSLSTVCRGDNTWVDSWFNNAIATGSGAGVINGSARNYYGLGYGSVRWQTGVDYPISIGLPSVRFGCGGVDIFLGSMDLMDFDYLVSRLKNIMYSAGAFAFQYALSRLNPKANQILQALDGTANFLNNLQLDECRAGKAVAAVMMSPFSKEAASDLSTDKVSVEQALGVGGSWQDLKHKWEQTLGSTATSAKITSTDRQRLTQQCPADMIDFLNAGSVLSYLATKHLILQDFVSVVRGVAGDVFVDKNSGAVMKISPCSQEKGDLIVALLGGKLQACTSVSQGKCTCAAFTEGRNIRQRVQEAINSYLEKLPQEIKNKTYPYTDGSEQEVQAYIIINTVRQYPVYDILKMAYQTGVSSGQISSDSNVVTCSSYFFGAGMLQNILSEAFRVEKMVAQWKSWCSQSADVGKCMYCKSDVINELESQIQQYRRNLNDMLYKQLQVQDLAKKSDACLQLEKTVTVLNKLSSLEKKYSMSVRVK